VGRQIDGRESVFKGEGSSDINEYKGRHGKRKNTLTTCRKMNLNNSSMLSSGSLSFE